MHRFGLDQNARNRLMHLLRNVRLLSLGNLIRFVLIYLREFPSNRRFRRENPDFPVPPARLAFDAYASINNEYYCLLGRSQAEYWAGLIIAHAQGRLTRILDWGCGPARVLRHMPALFPDPIEFYGTDYNRHSIRWARSHISGIRFDGNALLPPLPFEADSFDCAYAISVFTHLSEQSVFSWRDELFRILCKGGIFVFTTAGDNGRDAYLFGHERKEYDSARMVVRRFIKEGKKHFLSYVSPRYVRETFLTGRQVLAHIIHPYPYADPYLNKHFRQDIWVVRK